MGDENTGGTDRMLVLNFGRVATPSRFASTLRASSPYTKGAKGWTPEARRSGLFLDMGKVEFAEFSTLAQIALLVEGAVRHRIPVRIALPFPDATPGERDFVRQCQQSGDPGRLRLAEQAEGRIVRRRGVLDFMRHAGFLTVVRVSHVPSAAQYVTISGTWSTPEQTTQGRCGDPVSRGSEMLEFVERIFPLRWITPFDRAELGQTKVFAATMISFEEMGLSKSHARSLVGTVLGELVENVFQHANETRRDKHFPLCCPAALVGAVLLDPEKYSIKKAIKGGNFPECYRPFLEWVDNMNSPFLRLVLGDSGRGIPDALGDCFTPSAEEEIPRGMQPELTKVEKILLWSLNKWSTSDRERVREKRGTRGLWHVQRFVRAYGGALALRAEDALVGWVHGHDSAGTLLRDEQVLRRVPGTLVDVFLLTRPGSAGRFPPPEPRVLPSSVDFRLVPSVSCGEELVDQKTLGQAVDMLARVTPGVNACVVFSLETHSFSTRAAEEVLLRLSEAVSGLPNPGAFAVLLTDLPHSDVEIAAESLNEEWDRRRAEDRAMDVSPFPTRELMLLVSMEGEEVWFGGSRQARLLLGKGGRMSEGASALTDTDLRDIRDFVVSNEHDIAKRFTVPELEEGVTRHVRQIVHRAIEQGCMGMGVWRPDRGGVYLSPSLNYVSRWIDVHTLLVSSVGLGLAAYLLAQKIRPILDSRSTRHLALARVDDASAELARRIAACLGINSPIYAMTNGMEAYGQPGAAPVPPNTDIILCADLIHTAGTVLAAISETRRCGSRPIAIAVAVDARECGEEAIAKTKVVSLHRELVGASAPTQEHRVQHIDPVLRRPLPMGPDRPRRHHDPPLSSEELLSHCAAEDQTGLVGVGHIRRHAWRHFTSYVNVMRLMAEGSPMRARSMRLMKEDIDRWIAARVAEDRGSSGNVPRILLWYPGPADDVAGRMARELAEELEKTQSGAVVDVECIPRAVCGSQWVFPRRLDLLPAHTHVVFVDWGTVTATSVLQMMRLASGAGAVSFKAVVLISQLHSEDQIPLCSVVEVTAVRPPTPKTAELGSQPCQPNLFRELETDTESEKPLPEHTIRTEVTFLGSLRLGHFTPLECPVCRLRESLLAEADGCPTAFLQRHAEKTAERLSAVDRDEALLRSPQRDLYGAVINPVGVVAGVRLWQALDQALRSTESRAGILGDLTRVKASTDPSSKMVWVRLLASEPTWLKVPPLCFEKLRKLIGAIALDVVLNVNGQFPDEAERQQGIIVVRAASKALFAESLAAMFDACMGKRHGSCIFFPRGA